MVCLPGINLATDVPYWVTKSSFQQRFDQADFLCRDVRAVVDAYLKEWFDVDAAGRTHFILPPVSVHSGATQFISGRHRTAVLLRHLDRIPLSFDTRWLKPEDRAWIDGVVDAPIGSSEEFELPDLPVRTVLP
jgi:hypothetical protein